MKTFAVATIVALASIASAQLDKIPSCALNCFIAPLTSDGCASLTDFACHCKKGAELLATVQPCVKKACSDADQATTIAAVESTCAAAGAPIEIPDSSSAASSAVASLTSVASSAAASTTSAAASATSEVESATSEVESAASSAASSAVSSAHSAASSHATTATGATNGTASATSTVSQFTGGASQATQAAGLLGAAALALLAL